MAKFVKITFKNKNSFLKKIRFFLRHRQPLKYALYRYEWNKAPKKTKIRDFPVHLAIEPTNSCNLNCVFCARQNINYKFNFLDIDLYKKIIDEGSKRGLRSIKLSRGGESLLHPQFAEMIRYAREKGIIDIMFNTNSTLLSEDKSLEIINAKPDLVIFSVDAPDKAIYESQRVGANYEKTEANIRRFIELKNKIYPKILTRAHMVYTDESQHLIERHIERWQGLIDEITVNMAKNYSETLTGKKFKCRGPFRRLDIACDGSVYVCDPDYDPKGKLILGNVGEKSIFDMWHSTKMQKIRNAFLRNSPEEMDPCKYCRGI